MKNEYMRTSIIILSYNALDYTQLCLESIYKNTRQGTYEIIVVDNGSMDGSAEWLQSQKYIRCILNKDNQGFPKGCNQGLKIAKGENLLLLNNDTIVTPGWLDNLLTALHSRLDIGAVSCMTNCCQNEQALSLPYQSIEELMAVSRAFNQSNSAKWYSWMMLVGFCLLFKREVYTQLGDLDEMFSPGNFEDDDYCLRMRKAGYELLLCGDTYIHHFGSMAFTGKNDAAQQKAKEERYKALVLKNRAYFFQKWNILGTYRSHYRMTDSLLKTLASGQEVLMVNCDLGYELYWLKRRQPDVALYGLTLDKLGVEVTGKSFPLFFCEDFCEGLEKYYRHKCFARIAVLGNYQKLPNGEDLIQALQQHLNNPGILFFGDEEHIYHLSVGDTGL